jgi:hypothetical protein
VVDTSDLKIEEQVELVVGTARKRIGKGLRG